MQHPNKNPTATSGASAAVSLTAPRFSCLRPADLICLGGFLPATASLIVTLVHWLSTSTPGIRSSHTVQERERQRRRRRRDEPRSPLRPPGTARTTLLCILIAPLLSVKTIFSKSIKLFDAV